MSKGIWIDQKLLDAKITWTQRALLSEISQLEILDKGCIAENGHFAKKFGITESGISKALNQLAEKNYIIIDNAQTKRNFGRTITIDYRKSPIDYRKSGRDCGKSGRDSSQESKEKNPLKNTITNNIGNLIPSLQDVIEYLIEMQWTGLIDSQKFVDYYENRNWKNIHDWRSKVKKWVDNKSTNQTYSEIINPIIAEINQALRDGYHARIWKTNIAYTIFRQIDSSNWNMLSEKQIEFKVKELHKKVKNGELLELPKVAAR